MAVRVVCPHCSAEFHVPEAHVGRRARCSSCDESFVVGAPRGTRTEHDPLKELQEQVSTADQAHVASSKIPEGKEQEASPPITPALLRRSKPRMRTYVVLVCLAGVFCLVICVDGNLGSHGTAPIEVVLKRSHRYGDDIEITNVTSQAVILRKVTLNRRFSETLPNKKYPRATLLMGEVARFSTHGHGISRIPYSFPDPDTFWDPPEPENPPATAEAEWFDMTTMRVIVVTVETDQGVYSFRLD